MSFVTANTDRPRRPWYAAESAYGRTFHISALFILLILAMAGPFITVNEDQHVPLSGDGNSLRQISYTIVFAFVFWNFRGTKKSAFLAVPFSILLVLGWSWLSLTWAIEPGIAFRRLALTTVVIWTTFLAVRQARYRETLVDIRFAMLFGLIVNYAAVILLPDFGIHHVLEKGGDPDLIGTWKGVMLQKNFAGALCALTIIFHLFDGARMKGMTRVLVIAAASFFLYKTHSKTSMGLMAGSLIVGCAYLLYNPRYRVALFIASALVVVLGTMYVGSHFDELIAPFSSQEAFTGRGSIWPVTFHYWRDHWMGSGYGSFWVIGDDSPVFQYGKGWVTELGNGHNGYLDLLAEIGTPGLVLTLFAFIFWPLIKLLGSTTIVRQRGALLIASLLFCAGHNITESSLLDRDMIVQVFLTFTLAMIAEATKAPEKRRRRSSPAEQASVATTTIPRRGPANEPPGRRLVAVEPRYHLAEPG